MRFHPGFILNAEFYVCIKFQSYRFIRQFTKDLWFIFAFKTLRGFIFAFTIALVRTLIVYRISRTNDKLRIIIYLHSMETLLQNSKNRAIPKNMSCKKVICLKLHKKKRRIFTHEFIKTASVF